MSHGYMPMPFLSNLSEVTLPKHTREVFELIWSECLDTMLAYKRSFSFDDEYLPTFASICQVSCLVFLNSLIIDFTLEPTTPGSFAARTLNVARASGIHVGGGLLYGNAWMSAPRPKTAPCLVIMSRACSGVGVPAPDETGVDKPDRRILGRFGRGLSIRIFENRCLNRLTISSRRNTGEQRIMPDKVADAPALTSC